MSKNWYFREATEDSIVFCIQIKGSKNRALRESRAIALEACANLLKEGRWQEISIISTEIVDDQPFAGMKTVSYELSRFIEEEEAESIEHFINQQMA